MSTPEEIQREIEGTRRSLSSDVDRLTEKVSPGRVVSRRVDRLKGGVGSVRERVMGAVPDPSNVRSAVGSAGDSAGSGLSSAKGAMGNAVSTIGDAATSAPQAVRRQAQGNPLGAGLVAFGAGLVLSSLVPASEREKDLASKAEQSAVPALKEHAKEVASDLQQPVQESVQQVKEAATQAASDTADQARSAAQDVNAPLHQ